LPIEHWDVIKHGVHVCCFWLRCLASGRTGSMTNSPVCPQVLRREPYRFFGSILFALTYAFLPRYPDPLCDRTRWLIASFGRTTPMPSGSVSRSNEDQGEQGDFQNASDRPSMAVQLSRQLEITRMVAQCLETILSQSGEWAPAVWDSVLQFCLVICHYVLAFPLPIPGQRILPGSNVPNVTGSGTGGNVGSGGPGSGPGSSVVSGSISSGIAGNASSGTTGSTVADFVSTNSSSVTAGGGQSVELSTSDVASLAESIAESVFTLLMNAWLKACTQCFPRPQMWAALKECVKVWRHQIAVASIWSNVLFSMTTQLLIVLNNTAAGRTTEAILSVSECPILFGCHVYYEGLSNSECRVIRIYGQMFYLPVSPQSIRC
uniref:RALGAPB_N domain-containing protein n=1 Tax=Echinostoma caproni TaxID=27848 RepID=A0A183BG28_9TREM